MGEKEDTELTERKNAIEKSAFLLQNYRSAFRKHFNPEEKFASRVKRMVDEKDKKSEEEEEEEKDEDYEGDDAEHDDEGEEAEGDDEGKGHGVDEKEKEDEEHAEGDGEDHGKGDY